MQNDNYNNYDAYEMDLNTLEHQQRQAARERDAEAAYKKGMQKKALETSCYVCGAGAFSVFIRWLQTMLAFNDDGLVDASVFNVLVPLMILASGWLFLRFVDRLRNERYYVPADFYEAFANPGKLYTLARWTIGVIMLIGSVMLLIASETDKNAAFLRILSLIGVINGLAFPLVLSSANRPHAASIRPVCFLTFIPILFFCVWLVTCYKINSNNSVVWAYGPEAIAIVFSIIAFFRVAGFPFAAPNPPRAMFFCMLAAAMDIMIIADERYMGMQLMFFSSAMMLVLYNWLMICNLRQHPKPERERPDDGFERLRTR